MVIEWQQAEDGVRRYLKEWWGQEFKKQKLLLETDEGELELEFDAVSEDMHIIAEIKYTTHPEHPREMQLALDDIRKLEAVQAERKLLFLVDPLFYQVFCRKNQKDLLRWKQEDIEIVSPFELEGYLEG
jgi:hypothetical protein